MGYFQVRYNSRVVIYERKMFIILATDVAVQSYLKARKSPLRKAKLKLQC